MSESLGEARALADLPEAARKYVERVAELSEVPLCMVSVGARRSETIELSHLF